MLHDKKALLIICLLDAVKLSCWYMVPWLLFAGTTSLSLPDTMLLTALIQTLAAVIPCPSGIGAVEYVFSLFFGTYVSGVERGFRLSCVPLRHLPVSLHPRRRAGMAALPVE